MTIIPDAFRFPIAEHQEDIEANQPFQLTGESNVIKTSIKRINAHPSDVYQNSEPPLHPFEVFIFNPTKKGLELRPCIF
jgi:hypothetical protein